MKGSAVNSNELQLEFIGGNSVDKVAVVKKEIQLQNWSETDYAAIRIVTGDLKVEISSDVPSEKIAAIIGALKC